MLINIEFNYIASQFNNGTLVNLTNGGAIFTENSEFVWNVKENDFQSQLKSE
jgi:hypothetical protein